MIGQRSASVGPGHDEYAFGMRATLPSRLSSRFSWIPIVGSRAIPLSFVVSSVDCTAAESRSSPNKRPSAVKRNSVRVSSPGLMIYPSANWLICVISSQPQPARLGDQCRHPLRVDAVVDLDRREAARRVPANGLDRPLTRPLATPLPPPTPPSAPRCSRPRGPRARRTADPRRSAPVPRDGR